MTDRWEVRSVAMRSEITPIPEGWEPFAVGGVAIWIRRRVVPEVVRQLPRGVLTEQEMANRRIEITYAHNRGKP